MQIDPYSGTVAVVALVWAVVSWALGRKDAQEAERRQKAVVDALHENNTRLIEAYSGSAVSDDRLVAAVEAIAYEYTGEMYKDQAVFVDGDVHWTVEHVRKNTWLLRHLRGVDAEQVAIDRDSVGGARVDFSPELPCDIERGGSVEVQVVGSWGKPVNNEMRVSWGPADDRQTRLVPMPHLL